MLIINNNSRRDFLDDILFYPLSEPTHINKKKLLNEIKKVAEHHWIYDRFRNCSALPLITENGHSESFSFSKKNIGHNLQFTEYVKESCPTVMNLYKEYISTQLGTKGKLFCVRTREGQSNRLHIDCSEKKMNQRQHKWRWVIQGTTNSLFFITKEQKSIFLPEHDGPFIMDGRWPHGMINSYPGDKYTLAWGTPWSGSSQASYEEMIFNDRDKNKSKILLRSHFQGPTDLSEYFQA